MQDKKKLAIHKFLVSGQGLNDPPTNKAAVSAPIGDRMSRGIFYNHARNERYNFQDP
jgi:hypothetical protein